MTILITDITESARAIGISFGDYVLDGGYQDFDSVSSYNRSNFLFRPHRTVRRHNNVHPALGRRKSKSQPNSAPRTDCA